MANSLFGRKSVKPSEALHYQQQGEEERRVRTLEERHLTMERRIHLIENNLLVSSRKAHSDIQSLREEVRDVLAQLNDIKETVQRLVNALSKVAPKEEVDILRKELSFWDPFAFPTKNQVKRMIEEKIPVSQDKTRKL